MIARICVFAYGFGAYVISLGSFLYAIGFVGNRIVPKSIASGDEESLAAALLMNVGLLSLFAVQHSGMARPAKIIPQPVERSTYVLLTSLLLFLLLRTRLSIIGVGSAMLSGNHGADRIWHRRNTCRNRSRNSRIPNRDRST